MRKRKRNVTRFNRESSGGREMLFEKLIEDGWLKSGFGAELEAWAERETGGSVGGIGRLSNPVRN